jgi:hypothetical protein
MYSFLARHRHATSCEPPPAAAPRGSADSVRPIVLEAAGPTPASIQGTVDQFRRALGGPNNWNLAGPLPAGRREINWDGYGSPVTAVAPTPFTGFLNTRGALFSTDGSGFVQATVSGLAATFSNAAYVRLFQPFSPSRVFSPIDSTMTEITFFVPGGGEIAAVTHGFGAIFSGTNESENPASPAPRRRGVSLECFDAHGDRIFAGGVPSAAGIATLSFVGVVCREPLIACVVITSGGTPLGWQGSRQDEVVMDDFIFGEPRKAP